jgi:hypothetical protein
MICPQCRAEYRDGFTVCADCEVLLVPEYATGTHALAAPTPPAAPGDPKEDPFCSFWKGDDARLHAEICALLDEKSIPHTTIRREDHLFNLNSQPAFQIGVPFSQYERAETVIHDAFGTLEEETVGSPWAEPFHSGAGVLGASAPRALLAESEEKFSNASGEGQPSSFAGTPSTWDPDRWFPEDATTEVWASEDPLLGEMLIASLKENEIHCRWEERRGRCALYVLPQDEERAREIIRQIEEGAAPE